MRVCSSEKNLGLLTLVTGGNAQSALQHIFKTAYDLTLLAVFVARQPFLLLSQENFFECF